MRKGLSSSKVRRHETDTVQVPAPFEYERATSVDHALELLQRLGPGARLLAGGHSLLPMMKLRLAAPDHLIDLDGLADELGYIRQQEDEIRIGAMTRHRALLESELLAERLAIFTDAERVIADPVVRNRGTIGGAVCQADPSEDLSAVCAAVDARMVIRGPAGKRVVDVHGFHRGPYQTAVGEGEMLVEIRVPVHPATGSAYEKVERRVGDWAVAAAGASVSLADGAIERGGIALAAVGADITSTEAAEELAGKPPSDDLFAQVGRLAAAACSPVSDQRGSAEYKRHAAGVLTQRALRRATARALRDEV
jgi:aerobic carbon-monoxide dehydrogenase medium subunit